MKNHLVGKLAKLKNGSVFSKREKKTQPILNPFISRVMQSNLTIPKPDLFVPLTKHYGQRAEDLIVKSFMDSMILKERLSYKDIWYLELGANHPISTSATYLLYENGSSGCLVEPNPKLIEQLHAFRSRDKILHCAVVSDNEKTSLLYVSSASELSTLRKENLDFWPDYPITSTVTVPSKQINEILSSEYPSNKITFLSIDIEGPDFDVLESLDFENYPFDVIQIEPSNHINPHNTERILFFLATKNYSLVSVTEVNLIFQKQSTLCTEGASGNRMLSEHSISFDAFDTLIARRFLNPISVLKEFCDENGVDLEARIKADNGSRKLHEIYREANIPLYLMQFEIDKEIQHMIPIRENVELVRSKDVIVSDMYLENFQLRKILDSAGLPDCQIIVSNSDKATGKYWREIEEKPLIHIGDNYKSDYSIPRSFGIRTVYFKSSELTKNELLLAQHNEYLASLVREIRLRTVNSKTSPEIHIAIQHNLPFLFAFAELLNRKKRDLVFLGRDCFQLSEIYRAYFGKCHYLPFSRDLIRDPLLAKRYLRSVQSSNPLYVDLVSSGVTWGKLDDEFDVCVAIRINNWSYVGELYSPQKLESLFDSSELGVNLSFELLNTAKNGRVLSVDSRQLIPASFAPHEIAESQVNQLLSINELAVNLAQYYRGGMNAISEPETLARTSLQAIADQNTVLERTFSKTMELESYRLSALRKLSAE